MNGSLAGVANVVFSVIADAPPGSELRVVGSAAALGQWRPERGVVLRADPYPRWSATVSLPSHAHVEYKFVKVLPKNSTEWEEGPNRQLDPKTSGLAQSSVPTFGQQGRPAPGGLPPPPAVAGPPTLAVPTPPASAGFGPSNEVSFDDEELTFEASCTATAPGDTLRVVGSAPALGGWEPSRGLQLTTTAASFPRWSGKATVPRGVQVEWKLVILRAGGGADWESMTNRITRLAASEEASWTIRVQWEGFCGQPEEAVGLRRRSKSIPTQVPASVAPEPGLRRHNTEIPGTSGPPRLSVSIPAAPPTPAPAAPTARLAPPAQDEPRSPGRQPRRCASLSIFADVPPGRGAGPLALPQRSAVSVHEQVVGLTLSGVTAAKAPALKVEVAFETSANRWTAKVAPESDPEGPPRWEVNLGETDLQQGLQLFCFFVNCQRTLSSEHPIFGEWNAVLFHEPFRRYVLAKDSNQPFFPPITTPSKAPGKRASAFGDDMKGGLALPGQRQGNLARPYSICCNLVAMADDSDDDDDGVAEGGNAVASFDKDVFEGLFGAELRLRIDGLVLPELEQPLELRNSYHLWTGAHLLKKKVGACEDAYFANPHAVGVADGVGCMVQFASYGVNAAAYAQELMSKAKASLEPGGSAESSRTAEERAAAAMSAAENGAEAFGASTIAVFVMEGDTAGVANLGDSGFMLLRKGPRGMNIVKKSEEQQHSWNCPYQLTRLPPALFNKFPKLALDTTADSERYSFTVREGDLLLLFTDGLRDNLHEREILHIVDCCLSPPFADLVGLQEHCTSPDRIAKSLALAAQERSMDPVARVPFVEYSKRHGYECVGGKQDDITVVAAWVMSERQPIPEAPPIDESLLDPPVEASQQLELERAPGGTDVPSTTTASATSPLHEQDKPSDLDGSEAAPQPAPLAPADQASLNCSNPQDSELAGLEAPQDTEFQGAETASEPALSEAPSGEEATAGHNDSVTAGGAPAPVVHSAMHSVVRRTTERFACDARRGNYEPTLAQPLQDLQQQVAAGRAAYSPMSNGAKGQSASKNSKSRRRMP